MQSDGAAAVEGVPSAQGHVHALDGEKKPWLSILVPVYNVEPFVEECLRSILDQMDGDRGIELVVLDDRSTDGSAALCERVLGEHIPDSGVAARMMRHADNRGLSAARNSMLDVARGDYVWFIDSDDIVMPGAIATLRRIVQAQRPDIVLCDYLKQGEVVKSFAGTAGATCHDLEPLVMGVFATRRLHAWSRVWKRTLFDGGLRFPEGACFEDIATVPWLLLRAKSHHYAGEPWITYRSRPGSIIQQMTCRSRPFDTRRNNDLATALAGYQQELRMALPDAGPATMAAIGRFVAREFVKMSKRLLRSRKYAAAGDSLRERIGHYHAVMEANSPVAFAKIARDYTWRGKLIRAGELWLALALSRKMVSVAAPPVREQMARI